LQTTALSKQHGHRRGEKQDPTTDGEIVHRHTQVGEHRATCEQEEEGNSECNQHCSNQDLASPRRRFVFGESNEDRHDTRRVDYDQQSHKSCQPKSDEILIHLNPRPDNKLLS
jgi:hypothetical protein